MTLLLSIAGAVLPSLLLLRFFYKRDLYPEPRSVLLKTFVLGILTVIPVLIVVLPLMYFGPKMENPLWIAFYSAFLTAAIPEEFFKYLVVTRYSARNPAFDEPMDGIVYGATASLGFATLENILYVSAGGWGVAISRALTAVPCHACLGAILGYYVGQAKFGEKKWLARLGLIVATLLHAGYDFPLMVIQELNTGDPAFVGQFLTMSMLCVLFLGGMVSWTVIIVRRLRKEQEKG